MTFKLDNGKILKIKTGYNPNSSSIGTNLTPILIFGGMAATLLPIISFFIARHLKKIKKDDAKVESNSNPPEESP